MASSLLARSSRLLAGSSSSSSLSSPIYHHHPRGCSTSSFLKKKYGIVTKHDFYGKVLVTLDRLLLKRIPHTMCRTVRGITHEGVSLSIPGNEKRYETDEVLHIFLNFDAKDAKGGKGFRAELNFNHNAVFVSAQIQPTRDDYSFVRLYSSRINLGNEILYKTIHTEQKDGGLMLTLHKNPINVPRVKMSRSGLKPIVVDKFT